MTTPDLNPADREEALFAAACDLPPDRRAAFLDQTCGGHEALRARLEVLLRALDEAGDLLEQPPTGLDDVEGLDLGDGAAGEFVTLATEKPGDRIGRYKLLQQIGEGGCGLVYMADQEEPVRRRVALKVIKLGMDTRQVIARFEAERQALALMDHPNIARVLDGGATDAGRPYFVMELVRGTRITSFSDEHKLSTRARLKLFIQVCSAIQHAHQKGIVHRDLKPSNVLVTMIDGKPVPKVIDFGIAKATGQLRLTDKTLFTAFEQFIGTPAYMSPEQAEMSGVDIDTRSDIYSLGVLLYELLTGSTPFDTQKLVRSGIDGIRKTLREQEPPTPSTQLKTLAQARATSVASQRGTEPQVLVHSVRGDLDWIVMKALEKERARRYDSASDFAHDVQRHLRNEPVLARPPSRAYLFQKLVRRHQLAFAAGTAIAVLLVIGLAVSTSLYLQEQSARKQAVESGQRTQLALADAKAQRDLATKSELEAQAQRDAALKEKQRADNEAATAKAISDFLQNDLLSQAASERQVNQKQNPEPNLTVREALNRAASQISNRFQDQPLLEADIQKVIGDAYKGIGEQAKAIEHLEKSFDLRKKHLGPDHHDTLTVMGNLGNACMAASDFRRALSLLEEVLARRRNTFGTEHKDTVLVMNNLAIAYQRAGKVDLSVPLMEAAYKLRQTTLGPEHKDTLATMNNLASVYHQAGKLNLAAPLMEQVYQLCQAKKGIDHPETLTAMNNLALITGESGNIDGAISLYEEALARCKRVLGPDHPGTLMAMNNLGSAYYDAGKVALALPLYEETLKLRTAKLGPDHAATLGSMNNLAAAYKDLGKMELALPLYQETLRLRKNMLGGDHPDTLMSMNNLASTYEHAGQLDQAVALYEEAFKLEKAKLGPEHPDTQLVGRNLLRAYGAANKPEQARAFYAEANLETPKTPRALGKLADSLKAVGKLDLAMPMYEEAVKLSKATLGPTNAATLSALNNLAVARSASGRRDLSIPLHEEILRLKQAALGREHVDTFLTELNLGINYIAVKRHADAEPLLLHGYAGMKNIEASLPPAARPRIGSFARELVKVYTALNQPAKVADWKAKLEQEPKAAAAKK